MLTHYHYSYLIPILTPVQVYSAVSVAGASVKDKGMWDEVNEWLSQRR